jgi:hypothetical protein
MGALVQSQVRSGGMRGGWSDIEGRFPLSTLIPLPILIPLTAPCSFIIWRWHNRPKMACMPSWLPLMCTHTHTHTHKSRWLWQQRQQQQQHRGRKYYYSYLAAKAVELCSWPLATIKCQVKDTRIFTFASPTWFQGFYQIWYQYYSLEQTSKWCYGSHWDSSKWQR